MRDSGIEPTTIKDHAKVLGVKITGRKRRPLAGFEARRINEADAMIVKAKSLPHRSYERGLILATGHLSKAAYGWLERQTGSRARWAAPPSRPG